MSLGDSATIIITIVLASIIMFVWPLMTMADKKDDVSTAFVQASTTDLVDSVRTTGRLDQDKYDTFLQELASSGEAYDVEVTIYVLDENPSKKTTSNYQTIGDNVYYVMYTTQVMEALQKGTLVLKEGDQIKVSVKRTSTTLGEQLRNFLYRVTGNGTVELASDSGIITVNGN